MPPRILSDPRIYSTRVDTTLAAQPNDTTGPEVRAQQLIEWDPEGDINPPPQHFAKQHAPISERVPPMPPIKDPPPQADPVQFKNVVNPSGQPLQLELGFPAHSVIVDNLTNQWLLFTSARRWVAPYTYGAIISFMQSTQVAAYICAPPPGGFTEPVPVAGELVQMTWLAAFNAPSSGNSVTKA
jgi:hypothetical protein